MNSHYEAMLEKRVALSNNQEGVVTGIMPEKNLIKIETTGGRTLFKNPLNVSIIEPKAENNMNNYTIDQKFDFMAKMVQMVIKRVAASVVITGESGLGKTYIVNKELEDAGLLLGEHYAVVKGFSTPKGLYRKLYEENGKIIVFDDCDEVLDNDISRNILKGALDNYDKRIISWVTDRVDDSLPGSFEFVGHVIFISNKLQNQLDPALLNRSFKVDVSMSPKDKINRIRKVSHKMMVHLDENFKEPVLQFLDTNKYNCDELSFRTFINICKIKEAFPQDWEGMAYYNITQTRN